MKISTAGKLGFAAIILAGGLLAFFLRSPQRVPAVTPEEAERLLKEDSSLVILDVRTPEEFAGPGGHLHGARLIAVQELEARLAEIEPFRERTILVYCRTQNRSSRAAELLAGRGFRPIIMTGGITRWNAEQRPVTVEHQP